MLMMNLDTNNDWSKQLDRDNISDSRSNIQVEMHFGLLKGSIHFKGTSFSLSFILSMNHSEDKVSPNTFFPALEGEMFVAMAELKSGNLHHVSSS